MPSGSRATDGHEQQRDAGGHDTEGDAGQQASPGDAGEPRPHDDQHDHAGPSQPEPGGAVGPDPVEQPDRDREAELHAQHRGDRHAGAGAGRRPAGGEVLVLMAPVQPADTVRVHVRFMDSSFVDHE